MGVIRWGILGCGDVTEVKSGPGFQKAVGSELVAVMRRNARLAADYARRHRVARWYDNADKLIGDPEVDAVYVATPPGMHEFYTMKVLAARKACYVEKPMSRNSAEGRRMVEGFKKAGVPLFVAYYRRALPRFLKVKELLASGAIGRVFGVRYEFANGLQRKPPFEGVVPWRLVPEDSGGGSFLDLGSHALDLIDFWFGPLRYESGFAQSRLQLYGVVEDVVEMHFVTGGVPGSGKWDFTSEKEVDEYQIEGEGGVISVPCFANGPVKVVRGDGREEVFDLPHPAHVAQPLIQTVVNELLGVGKCASTGESGLRTQVVIDAALEEYYGGREDGFWERVSPRKGKAGRG